MDDLTAPDTAYLRAAIPPRAPLDFPAQDFAAPPAGVRPPGPRAAAAARAARRWRLVVFGTALLTTVILVGAIYGWLSAQGLTWLETALLALIGATFVWTSHSVATVLAAVLGHPPPALPPRGTTRPLSVALLVPIYNEAPVDVFGNAAAMLADLARAGGRHRFTLFILSDTRDPAIGAQEWRTFRHLRDNAPDNIAVHYRRRAENTDKKVGNIADWIAGWGAAHEAMIVLDADSLMSGQAIRRLARALAADPEAGLIQSVPTLIRADTLFARIQQFSSLAYGWLLAEGLALWAQREGNYWGHNAIIRTRAFAAAAGLPRLAGRFGRGSSLILSHDFVEAGLLRRAGWAVRFMPRTGGSYEETPATLVDHVLRDRRWCRGNLQHLRLLGARGFHPVSRFHMFHGAVSYLLSPAWFALLVIWTLLGRGSHANVIHYFNEASPLYPDWPEMSRIDSFVFLFVMYAMLLVPKCAAAIGIAGSRRRVRPFGGYRAFLGAFLFEVIASIVYAPILMVQQTRMVLCSAMNVQETWQPQVRQAQFYPLGVLMRFHAAETIIGLALVSGIVAGLVSPFLIPIGASLLFAVPLSAAGTIRLSDRKGSWFRLETPHTIREPGIVSAARTERRRMQDVLADGQRDGTENTLVDAGDGLIGDRSPKPQLSASLQSG